MATSYIPTNISKVESHTFSIDCTNLISGVYYGTRALTTEEINGAKAIIPINARTSGTAFVVTAGYENGALRVASTVSLANVLVTCIYLY